MRDKATILSVLILTGALVWSAAPVYGEGVLYKQRLGQTNYCHMKFPAIQENTLSGVRPVLKDSGTSDIIDFYGPCNYDPTGTEAVEQQRLDEERRWREIYSG